MQEKLKEAGYSVRRAAEVMGLAHSTLHAALKGKDVRPDVWDKITAFCQEHGIYMPQTRTDEDMLIRKESLSQRVLEHFGLRADPFGEVFDRRQVYLSKDLLFVRETMLHTATFGGLLAVVGESGAGKSTLRKDLHERLAEEYPHVVCIYPQVLSSEDNGNRGQVLRASHIMEAILATVAPGRRIPQSPEIRGRACVEALTQSARSGGRHVLILEEAHTLSRHTIKHLKRFFEIEDGFTRLLSIIMIGQQELLHEKLRENDAQTREVVQRCQVVELKPLVDVDGYIRHRLASVGGGEGIWTKEASDALAFMLSNNGHKQTYPLALGNLANKALTLAASTGEEVVTREVVLSI